MLIEMIKVAVVFTIPIPFMVMYNWPRDRPIMYQTFLTFSTWIWSVYQLLFMYVLLQYFNAGVVTLSQSYLCGFYSHHGRFQCGDKDFLATF